MIQDMEPVYTGPDVQMALLAVLALGILIGVLASASFVQWRTWQACLRAIYGTTPRPTLEELADPDRTDLDADDDDRGGW